MLIYVDIDSLEYEEIYDEFVEKFTEAEEQIADKQTFDVANLGNN